MGGRFKAFRVAGGRGNGIAVAAGGISRRSRTGSGRENGRGEGGGQGRRRERCTRPARSQSHEHCSERLQAYLLFVGHFCTTTRKSARQIHTVQAVTHARGVRHSASPALEISAPQSASAVRTWAQMSCCLASAELRAYHTVDSSLLLTIYNFLVDAFDRRATTGILQLELSAQPAVPSSPLRTTWSRVARDRCRLILTNIATGTVQCTRIAEAQAGVAVLSVSSAIPVSRSTVGVLLALVVAKPWETTHGSRSSHLKHSSLLDGGSTKAPDGTCRPAVAS